MSVEQLEREVTAFLERIYSSRSVRRRATHPGMWRRPAQLVHHYFVNGALGSYYRDLNRGTAPRLQSERLDRLATDVGCWILDRLLGTGSVL